MFVLCDEIGTSGSETVQGKSHLDRFLQSKSAGVTEKCSGNYTNEQTGWNFFFFFFFQATVPTKQKKKLSGYPQIVDLDS